MVFPFIGSQDLPQCGYRSCESEEYAGPDACRVVIFAGGPSRYQIDQDGEGRKDCDARPGKVAGS